MSWFSKIFSSIGVDLTATVGKVIDDLVTSDEELALTEIQKMKIRTAYEVEMKRMMVELDIKMAEHEENLEAQLTERLRLDMKSDSWLSKNVRPLALIFMTTTVMLLAYLTTFVDLQLDENSLKALTQWIDLFTYLLMTIYGFYFGSRGLEKIQKIRSGGQTDTARTQGRSANQDMEPRG